MEGTAGILYLCATPIGNLEDMTFRAVRLMGEVELIAAEDTRHTRKLLSHYEIHTPLVSYHEHNKMEKGPELIDYLLSGKDLLLVSDAGLPGIADPGSHLAQLAIEAGVQVTPLPGANAALPALICSGLDTTAFYFAGFLPKTAKKRRETLALLQTQRATMIFYESPHRLKASLQELIAVFGADRPAAAARELTKKFEEFIRGTLGTLAEHVKEKAPRGEFCLVVAGCPEESGGESAAADIDPAALVAELMAGGAEKKSAIKEAALRLGLPKRSVYQAALNCENIK